MGVVLFRRLAAFIIALMAAGPAWAIPTEFKLGDGSAGPSCIYYSGMGPLRWQHTSGDWIDSEGRMNGSKPFSTLTVQRGQGRPFVEVDVLSLLQRWLTDPTLLQVVVLRGMDPAKAGDVIDFHSRESKDAAARPILKLEWEDGRRDRLTPLADTFLDCSTVYSLGQRPELKLGGERTVLVRFELPKVGSRLKRASLYLSSDVQYGGASQDIGVYGLRPAFSVPGAVVQGLAASFPQDQGIDKDKDVYFSTGFDELNWLWHLRDMSFRGDYQTVTEDRAQGFEPLIGKALKATIRRGEHLGLDLHYRFSRHQQKEPQELYFRYYLRFARDWNPSVDGGKLPGIAGTYGRAGWGMRKPDGFNGWSVRGGFARRPGDDPSVVRLTSLVSYIYHVDQSDNSGAIYGWGAGPSGILGNERWYCVEQYVKLNDPGQRNGIVRAWVDGSQVLEQGGLRFRDTDKLGIEEVWLDVYHGGMTPAPHDLTLYIDNVVIARRYIGPALFKGTPAQ